MINLKSAIQALADDNVDFVIVGGVAIKIHSSAYFTLDLDFCYARTKENLIKIVSALSQFNPRPHDFPEDLPYFFDTRSLQNATNFTFETKIGDIDLLAKLLGLEIIQRQKSLRLFLRFMNVMYTFFRLMG